ncbi:MAG: AI-2E family transporter [Planctomycetia bacterium]|nr:AI-2E family transporter [Planctomycetia bacterium]
MAARDQPGRLVWMLASIAVVVAALYLAKGVLVPLTLAVLLSFLLSPVCDWLERRGLGRIPAVFATVVVGFAVFGAATWTAVVQMTELAPRLPEYQRNFQAKLHSINHTLSAALNKVTQTAEELDQDLPSNGRAREPGRHSDPSYAVRLIPTPASPMQVLSGTFGTILQVLGSAGVVILLVVFFLVRREDLRDRFVHLIGRGHLTVTTQTLEDAATRVSRYLTTQFLLNLSFGVPVAVGLYFIGVPNALLWGIAAVAFRFVPYIGSMIAAAMPIGLAMAISPDWIAPLLTLGLFVALELVISNILEPWLYGKHTGVSAVAVLVAAVFWTWLWGSIGLLLATPLTVCLLVLGKHVPQLSFLNILLGNEPVFELQTRVYQRLLAGDQEEASELVEEALAQSSLAEVYDTVLIPALALAESDRRRGDIDEGRQKFIFQSLNDTIDDLGERRQELPAQQVNGDAVETHDGADVVIMSTAEKPCILLLPARNEADEIAATMLAHLLATTGYRVETVSKTVLAGELVNLIAQRQADVVCISAMPPAAATHARYLCRRLQGKFPAGRLIVGLWNAQGDLTKARTRIDCEAAVRVVTTLAQAREQIQVVLQPLLVRREPPHSFQGKAS